MNTLKDEVQELYIKLTKDIGSLIINLLEVNKNLDDTTLSIIISASLNRSLTHYINFCIVTENIEDKIMVLSRFHETSKKALRMLNNKEI